MKLELAIDLLRNVCRLRHLSLSTEAAYCGWVERFSRFLKAEAVEGGPEQKMEAFLTSLAKADFAVSTQNQAFSALLFLYRDVMKVEVGKVDALRARRPVQLRYAPERAEVLALLDAVRDVGGYPTVLIVKLIYGCGLRVSEPLNLRLRDVLLRESRLIVRAGKGGKDRMVAIPCALLSEMVAQVKMARAAAERDVAGRVPVALPGRLAVKYPRCAFSAKWCWLFPARTPCRHPRTGETVRWRCHEANVQRCVRVAARELGLDVTPHHLRHAYATHCLNGGQNPRAIQEAMGHASLETTMGYLHAAAIGVRSPLD